MAELRFGERNLKEIRAKVVMTVPQSTKRSRNSVWEQFKKFCDTRKFSLTEVSPISKVSSILEDYAFNMKKCDGEDYKDSTLKTMWNTTAKMVHELYFDSFNVKMNPFSDIEFKSARAARDGKRKQLQSIAEKRKVSSISIVDDNYEKMIDVWNEDTPSELQKKFYQIAARELAWRGGEPAKCLIEYFQEEKDCTGKLTGRYEYNPVFSKTCQGGSRRLCDSKWLVSNEKNPNHCPVRAMYNFLLDVEEWHIMYSPGYTNMGAYITGLMFGNLYYQYRDKKVFIKKIYTVLWWILGWMTPLVIIFIGVPIYNNSYQHSRIAAAIYASLARNIFAIAFAIVIFGITKGIGWVIRDATTWPLARILGKLTYSAFLVHLAVIRVRLGLARFPGYATSYVLITQALGDITVSYIFALVLCIFVEMPITALQKLLIPQIRDKEDESTDTKVDKNSNHNTSVTISKI